MVERVAAGHVGARKNSVAGTASCARSDALETLRTSHDLGREPSNHFPGGRAVHGVSTVQPAVSRESHATNKAHVEATNTSRMARNKRVL